MSVQIAAGSLPHRRGRYRRKTAERADLLTVRNIDGRSRAGLRVRSIVAELESRFDEITPLRRAAIERAATLCVIAEDLAARQLAGLEVSLDEVLRAEGVARRAVRAIVAERPAQARESASGLAPLKW